MNRETFLKSVAFAGLGLSINPSSLLARHRQVNIGKRVGIIGLDTSHSPAFARALNAKVPDPMLKGYTVVAAYPYGSQSIASSADRIPRFANEVKALGVKIVDSIEELIDQVDVVLLETNDGRLHLEQAKPVFQAGKRMFIDKPIAASLHDAKAIFDAARHYNVPVFSSSSMRNISNINSLKSGEAIGPIAGVDVYSPAKLEPTHPDLMWYGIHGVEMLYAIMGEGCKEVRRIFSADTDIVIGTWADGRVGTFRGIRKGMAGYGGIAFGERGQQRIGKYEGYLPQLYQIIEFFETGVAPVPSTETIEMMAFMEAADASKFKGGEGVNLADFLDRG